MSDQILMPKRLTAENGAKYLFMGEFKEINWVACPECDGHGFTDCDYPDMECELCDGSGQHRCETAISWSTIKDIYALAVEKLGKPPTGGDA